MGLLPSDFESDAYTNFATQARTKNIKLLSIVSQMLKDRNLGLSRSANVL